MSRSRALGRAARAVATVAGTAAVFAVGLVGGLTLHLGTAPARRLVARVAEAAVGGALEGSLRIGRIRALSTGGLAVDDVSLAAPDGRVVAHIDALEVTLWPGRVVELLRGGPLVLDGVRLRGGFVDLTADAEGLVLSRAVAVRGPREARPREGSFVLRLPVIRASGVQVVTGDLTVDVGALAGELALSGGLFVRARAGEVSVARGGDLLAAGGLRAELALEDGSLRAGADVRASVLGAPVWATASLRTGPEGPHLSLSATGEGLDGALARLAPGGEPPRALDGAAFDLRAEGALDDLGVLARVRSDVAGVWIGGRLDVPALEGRLSLAADALDPGELTDAAPHGWLAPSARVTFDVRARSATAELSLPRGELAGLPLPQIEVAAERRGDVVWVGAWAEDEGLLGSASASFSPGEARFSADLDADGSAPGGVRALLRGVGLGEGTLRGGASVRGAVAGGRFDVAVEGRASELALAGVAARDARLDASAKGSLSDLGAAAVGGTLRVGAFASGGVALGALSARVTGTADAPEVVATLSGKGREIEARAALDVPKRAVKSLSVAARAGDDRLGIVASDLALVPSGVELGAVRIEGAAKGGGSFGVRGGVPHGTFRADDVDLAALGRLAGLSLPVGGLASIDAHFDRTAAGAPHGRLRVLVEDGAGPFVRGIGLSLAVDVEGRKVSASAAARLVDDDGPCKGASLAVRVERAEGVVAGDPFSAAAWRSLVGGADVALDGADLECLRRRVPLAGLFVSRLGGVVRGRARIERTREGAVEAPRFVVRTTGLEVDGPRRYGLLEPGWKVGGVDVQLEGALGAKAQVSAIAFDAGTLASLDVDAELGVGALIAGLRGGRKLAEVVDERAWRLVLDVPRRGLATLGALPEVGARLAAMGGGVRAHVEASGGASRARAAKASIDLDGFGLPEADRDWLPDLDVHADATLEGTKLAASGRLRSAASELARFEASTDVAPDGVRLDGQVELLGIALGKVPALARREIAGNLRGLVRVQGLPLGGASGAPPSVEAALVLTDGRVAGGEVRSTSVWLRSVPTSGADALALVLAEVRRPDGAPELRTAGALTYTWKDGRPFAGEHPFAVRLRANDFDLAALAPLAPHAVRKLGGKLAGEVAFGAPSVGELARGSLSGELALSGGELVVPGQALRDVAVRLRAREGGVVEIAGLAASIGGGRLSGDGRARLGGLQLDELALAAAIPERSAISLALEGAPIGALHGVIGVRGAREAQPDGRDRFVVRVELPSLGLELAQGSSRNLQPLDDHPAISIAGRRKADEEEAAPLPVLHLVAELGEARVRGSGVDLRLRTDPESPIVVDTAGGLKLGGKLVVLRGEVEVVGRRFEIERGLVDLGSGVGTNPYVNVSARHDAANGTRVYVEYRGLLRPIRDDKLVFRSEPARSKQEILALLALPTSVAADAAPGKTAVGSDMGQGTVNGAGAAQSLGQAAAGAAGNVGGALAADQVNALLHGVPALRGLTTSFGVSDRGGFTAAFVVEANDKLSARIVAESPAQQQQGTVGGSASQRAGSAQITLDWRFYRDLLLRASVGIADQVTSGLDLLWQHRF